jgi:hypothetical protein
VKQLRTLRETEQSKYAQHLLDDPGPSPRGRRPRERCSTRPRRVVSSGGLDRGGRNRASYLARRRVGDLTTARSRVPDQPLRASVTRIEDVAERLGDLLPRPTVGTEVDQAGDDSLLPGSSTSRSPGPKRCECWLPGVWSSCGPSELVCDQR